MNLILALLASLLLTCHAKEDSSGKQDVNVSKNFRKALLEALEQLEKEEAQNKTNTEIDEDDLEGSDFDDSIQINFGNKMKDKIPNKESLITSFSDAGKGSVFVHSFSTDNQPIEDKESENLVRYRTKLAVDNAISASSVNGKNDTKTTTISLPTSTSPKPSLSSPSPTVSTPVEEDETQAKVEDVQFIHAPLVAAFTVQQDSKGLPHKVIPIYGNKQSQNPSPKQTQENIQLSLEEKQRQLEQQIRILQEQKRQQEILLQQQASQRQKLLFEEQQKYRLKVQNDITNFSQNLQEQNRQNFLQNDKNEENLQQNRYNIPVSTHFQEQNRLINPIRQNFVQNNQNEAKNQQNNFNIPISSHLHEQNRLNNQIRHNYQQNDQNEAKFQQNRFNTHIPPHLQDQNRLNSQIRQNYQLTDQQNEAKLQENRFNIPIPNQNDNYTPRPTKDLSNSISFQPSISFEANGFKPINTANQNNHFNQYQFNQQQGLPVKSPVNFQKAINIPITSQDNLFTEQQTPNQYRNNVFNNNEDNYLQDFFYRQRTLVPPPRSNRFFRQETQVGNFGTNDFTAQNQYQQRFNPIQNFRYNNQFNARSNVNQNRQQSQFGNFQHNNVDSTLKNLLYQSGLGQSHSQEDLNIVSKVLALDHTGNYQQNYIFGESNLSEKKIPYYHLNSTFKT